MILATCFGAYVGILTQRTKSVVPAIACHSASNILFWMVSVQDFKRLYAMNVLLVVVSLFAIIASLRRILSLGEAGAEDKAAQNKEVP